MYAGTLGSVCNRITGTYRHIAGVRVQARSRACEHVMHMCEWVAAVQGVRGRGR